MALVPPRTDSQARYALHLVHTVMCSLSRPLVFDQVAYERYGRVSKTGVGEFIGVLVDKGVRSIMYL